MASIGLMACASGGDATGGVSDANEVESAAVEQKTEGAPEGSLLFLACSPESDSWRREEPAFGTIHAIDPVTGSEEILAERVRQLCDSFAAPDMYVTTSGRFVIGFNRNDVIIVDLMNGGQMTVGDEELDAWLMEQSSSDLDAKRPTSQLGGLDRDGDGKIYFSDSDPFGWDLWFLKPDVTYYSVDVAQLVDSRGAFAAEKMSDQRYCYASRRWSTDGRRCLLYGSSGSSVVVPVDATGDPDLGYYEIEGAYESFAGPDERSHWIDSSTVIGSADRRSVLRHSTDDADAEVLYEMKGDRMLTPWVDSKTGNIYFASRTLNEESTELYSLDPTHASEATHVAAIDGRVSLIAG